MMKHLRWMAAIPIFLLLGCAGADRYKLPPPRNTQLLATAQGVVYAEPAASAPVTPSRYCVTSGGSCALPAPVETGLSCTCESASPKYSYGGRTGAMPPMPEWADPSLAPR